MSANSQLYVVKLEAMKAINRLAFILALILTFGQIKVDAQHNQYFEADPTLDVYVDYGRALDIDPFDTIWENDKLTITMWMRWWGRSHPDVGNWANIFTMSDSNGSGDNGVFWIQHNSVNSSLEFAIHSTRRNYVQSSAIDDSVWYHIAAVYDGSLPNNNMKLYVNGGQEASRNKSGNVRNPPNKSKLTMGRWPNPGNGYPEFKGHIDEVSIWNRALSNIEIDSIMVNPESVTGMNYDAVGLISYWNFDDSTANDATGNHVDGVIQGIDPFGTMPIHLSSFNGFAIGDVVLLNWTTDSEINNAYFEVQRSANGVIWETISEISAAGNSNRSVSYTIEDYEPKAGTNYYRLKQVDFDGKFTISEAIDVDVEVSFDQLGFEITMFNNNDGFGLMIMSEDEAIYTVDVFDIQGVKVKSFADQVKRGGVNTHKQISNNLKSGVYIVMLRCNDLVWSARFKI